MTVENMEKIHQLSYTLENALKRMDKDLASIANVLEGMHLASEARNEEKVQGNLPREHEHDPRAELTVLLHVQRGIVLCVVLTRRLPATQGSRLV
jgi:hypothetical protein